MRRQHFKLNWILALFMILAVGCCGGSSGSSGSSSGTSGASATLSGAITFADVPTDNTSGLVYSSTVERPVRGVVV